jgi:polyisoprenoid-binding protein YceI
MIHPSYRLLTLLFASASSLFAGNFNIDKARSELSATMHASPSHDFTSGATDYTYDIQIDPETLVVTKAICSFKFSDLDSGKSSRDKKMRKWIDVDKYPAATFEMKTRLPDNDAGEQVASGTFTMHGVSLPMNITFTVKKSGDQITLDGHTKMNHLDWKLEQVKLFFFSVDPVLKPSFHLEGTLTTDA